MEPLKFGSRRLILALALYGAIRGCEDPGLAQPAAPRIQLGCATNQVRRFERVDFSLEVAGAYGNPFNPDEVDVGLRLVTPSGQVAMLPAFWYQGYERRHLDAGGQGRDWLYPVGMPHWSARFAPMQTGQYNVTAILKLPQGSYSSQPLQFACVPSGGHGFIRVGHKDPRFLEYEDGTPFFPIGQNLAFIGSQQYVTLSKAEEIFGRLAENGANYLRIWTCCDDWAMAIEARKSAWGRSWDWHPPTTTDPAPEHGGETRKVIRIPAGSSPLNVEPSHGVALRPKTRYVISGRIRTEKAAVLIEANGAELAPPLASSTNGAWTRFSREFQTGADDFWLREMRFQLQGVGAGWLDELSMKEASGGPELLWEADVNREVRGFYNPLDCFLLDEIVSAAERRGVCLQLCLLTRDLYMGALKDAASADYGQAIGDARKALRYAVARWGCSTSVAAWEYWNEMDPGLPTGRFYTELGDYLEAADPYHHLRTTSTWGPSAKDCRHPEIDIADAHFYLRPSDKGRLEDEVDAVIERTGWLRTQAPNKPVHLGEFGLADEKWRLTPEMRRSSELADVHNALWASALSGASGTAMFWWWERLDQHDAYRFYRPLSRFIAEVPWNSGQVQSASVTCSDAGVRPVGLRSTDRAWLWLFARDAAWGKIVNEGKRPRPVSGAELALNDLPEGSYRVRWWDTRSGGIVQESEFSRKAGLVRFPVPEFTRDIACAVSRR